MAEELQSLLERIKKDGADKAQAEAARILDAARQKAGALVAQAEQEARAKRADVDRAARESVERGRKTLEQAARDVILLIGEALNAVLREIVRRDVGQALREDALRSILLKAVEVYGRSGAGGGGIELLLSQDDRNKLADSLMAQFVRELKQGVEIKADGSILRGFKARVKGQNVEHDFTQDAIVDALCQIARPRLAEIVRSAGGPR
ncbi:MAG: hypothetical protein QME60_01690 [Verrucomicrobiota bacterium]|nr:hypothetical protein [Verrucomicrobiota bacterium]